MSGERSVPTGTPFVANTEVWLTRAKRWHWECRTCSCGSSSGHRTFTAARDAAVIHQKVNHT